MQQTVDVAVKETKDLDLETIPAYGLFYFYSAAADAETATATDSAAANKNAHRFQRRSGKCRPSFLLF